MKMADLPFSFKPPISIRVNPRVYILNVSTCIAMEKGQFKSLWTVMTEITQIKSFVI